MIKWIYRPSGFCPVQAEGFFMGKYFYFRSRWSTTSIEFSDSQKDWKDGNILRRYVLMIDKYHGAGWLPHWQAHFLVYVGCMKFLFKMKSTVEDKQNN